MSYTIRFEDDPPRLSLELSGFWDSGTMAGFGAELKAAREAMIERHPCYDVLIDTRAMQIQSAMIIAGFQQLQASWLGRNDGRVALIVQGALPRMQAKRATVDPRFTLFDSLEPALAWLSETRLAA